MGQDEGTMQLSDQFAVWVKEALELARPGMPKGSFELVFRWELSARALHSGFFSRDVTQRDAVWQRLIEMKRAQWEVVESDEADREAILFAGIYTPLCYFNGNPDTLDDVAINKHELLQCFFFRDWPKFLKRSYRVQKNNRYSKPGPEADFETFDALSGRRKQFIDMAYPLPPWKGFIAEEILLGILRP